jgi:SAM-dependent methyltransferase
MHDGIVRQEARRPCLSAPPAHTLRALTPRSHAALRRRSAGHAANEVLRAAAMRDLLREAFGEATPDHLAWQTTSPVVSDHERALVRATFLPLGRRVLDLGCGEGATLLHLGSPEGGVGVDLFEKKLELARKMLPGCRFVAASADALPFDDASFDHVLVRDLIHHLEDPGRAMREIRRVLVPGGRVDVLEPCRYNPLIALHALTQPVERGELRSTVPFLRELVARIADVVSVERYQPMPLHRLVFHPMFGKRAVEIASVRTAVDLLERLAERVVPRWSWAYIHVRGLVAAR